MPRLRLTALTWPYRLLLNGLLRLLVRPHFTPDLQGLRKDRPTFYLLDRYSLTEKLLLQRLIRQHQLPATGSQTLGNQHFDTNLLCLQDLEHVWQALQSSPDADLQLIPISFFWGRAPGREESLLKIITADSWAFMGGIRRLFAILLHGRQLWVEAGQPVRARRVMAQPQLMAKGASYAANKSRRLLQLYFRRVRTRILGPDLSHRRTLVNSLMNSPALRAAIQQQAQVTSPRAAREQALAYINEIASNVSYPVLLVMDRLLSRLWNQLYDGIRITGLDKIKALAGQHTLVYLPCHRSHIDYLLLSYVLFKNGLMPPHIAAGINLNMPVIGPLLRRGGAFFMRRSFRDNPLYSAVFNEYFYHLLKQGHPVEFFVEGGRSRTGRTLPPKAGMLTMTLKAAERGVTKPLLLIPVHLGYEKVLEGSTYLHELRGKSKKKESPLDLLRVIRNLRQYYGQVDVSFGAPIPLTPASDNYSESQTQKVSQLCRQVACGINHSATLNRTNLLALALLASPHRVLEANNLLAQMQILAQLANMNDVTALPDEQPEDWLAAGEKLGFIEKMPHPLGDLYRCNEQQGILLTWYRNNALHLFALQGLVAFLFMNQKSLSSEQLKQQALLVYPLLVEELFLPLLEDQQLGAQFDTSLEQLTQLGLLEKTADQHWQRPAEHLPGCMRLRLLGSLVQPALERFYLLLALLERNGNGQLTSNELIDQSREMAQRLTILQGLDSPEYSDSRLFTQALQQLIDQGWISLDEHQRLVYSEELLRVTRQGRKLFDPQLRHSLLSLTWQQPSE